VIGGASATGFGGYDSCGKLILGGTAAKVDWRRPLGTRDGDRHADPMVDRGAYSDVSRTSGSGKKCSAEVGRIARNNRERLRDRWRRGVNEMTVTEALGAVVVGIGLVAIAVGQLTNRVDYGPNDLRAQPAFVAMTVALLVGGALACFAAGVPRIRRR